MENKKTTKEFWESGCENFKFKAAKPKDSLRLWIEKYIPPAAPDSHCNCIEIGCFPGTYLAIFGDLGYRLNGLDYCRQLNLLPPALKKEGYKVGEFWEEDFLTFDAAESFDVVSSFGLVEHFVNFEELIEKHIDMLKVGGYLVMEAPNFIGGFQNWFHAKFDTENYERHHIPAMDISVWKKVIEARGMEIVYAGYFGRFNLILEKDNRPWLQSLLVKSFKKMKGLIDLLVPANSKSFSPYCGIIARKV